MLNSLHIENIAVVKSADIDLGSGFTVFSGETGAGKSVIIESIKLLLGGKFDKELIRHGEDLAMVSALITDLVPSAVAALSECGFLAEDTDYAESVTVIGSVISSEYDKLCTSLSEMTSGRIKIEFIEEKYDFRE
jgi:DNA repair ATPase RecN